MHYYVYHLRCRPEIKELLLAFLEELPFHSFMEVDTGWEAHPQPEADPASLTAGLESLAEQFDFSWEIKELAAQNWNAVWEAGFQPIRVGSFCGVRAPFHPPVEGVAVDLLISPRMAFGTGHHETTYMMIAAMEKLPLAGARVLDYGCGTGILAILAARLQAARVDAVDIEAEACANTLDNARLNDVHLNQVITGQLKDVPVTTSYDVILANINRNVILESLPALYDRLREGGLLLVSGILHRDETEVLGRAQTTGFRAGKAERRGEWSCLLLARNGAIPDAAIA